jgi:hypothetical protein
MLRSTYELAARSLAVAGILSAVAVAAPAIAHAQTGDGERALLNHIENPAAATMALSVRPTVDEPVVQGPTGQPRARENWDAAYRGGVVSLIEVLDADSNLLQVRDAKAQAQTEAARAAVGSFRALGGGWDAPHVHGTAPTATLDEPVHEHRQSTR